ncbi:hypothetical protein KSP39_PZI013536 [Platanthera zijinensis]|uniref:ribonuclease Z n=1 Tax=Platanthera zijinensis TaxID=2320716 RepID=A0AAP0BFW0_9ASPA
MSQISALRILCSSSCSLRPNPLFRIPSSSSLLFNPPSFPNSHRHTHFVFSYSRRTGRRPPSGGGRFNLRRISTLTERRRDQSPAQGSEMEEKDGMEGFNKRRAEGNDKSDKRRNLQLKSRKLNPVNTLCYVQILGTGMDTQDTSPSVFLFFDKQRFIFNAGEGLQRFCTEHKIKLSKVDHIFLTRVSSETAGGLPGLLLTLAGMGEEGMLVNIWGPSDLKFLVDAMRSFIPNATMVHTHSFGETQNTNGTIVLNPQQGPIVLIDDEVVRLSAITLRPNSSRGTSMKPGDVAVVYVCELPEIKGKFDPEKAASLGLNPGPKYRELQLGNSVMSDRLNIMVHSSDVLDPSIPGPVVLVVDCPTSSHMEELFSAQSLNSYYVNSLDCQTEGIKLVNCIIHLGPASVTKNADYLTWMKRFGQAQHIMAGHEMDNIKIPIFKSSARISSRLNYLCPQLFPHPGVWPSKDGVTSSLTGSIVSDKSSEFVDSVSAENLLKFHLRPYSQLGLDRSAIPSLLNPTQIFEELHSEIPEIEDVSEHISQLWRNHNQKNGCNPVKVNGRDFMEEPWISEVSIPACLDNVTREDMEIVLLGTGSSQPSKYRNVSSIFVNLFSKGSMLLDCGEGTLGQLKRRFGVEGADIAVKALKCIWISHIHSDHHTGLTRVLALRCQLLKDVPHEPLLVIGPRQLKRYLDAYSRLEDLDLLFLDCWHTTESFWHVFDENCAAGDDEGRDRTTLFSQGAKMQSFWKRPGGPVEASAVMPVLRRLKELLHEAGLDALWSVPVVHCPQAYAVVFKAAERANSAGRSIPGWKLVYSGDTRPCQSLIDASRDATVLIHEATFEDSLRDEAVARNHSTTMEAIQVGTEAAAYRIILTHFSQRYPKIPVFDEAHMHNTCIAFDLMSVNLADLPLLPHVLPHLKILFRNELAVDGSD